MARSSDSTTLHRSSVRKQILEKDLDLQGSDDPSERDPMMNMAQVLTHRLSSLVNIIEGYTDLLADSLATPDQREMALRIFESAAGIDRILADLRRYSQPIQPVYQKLSIERLVSGALAAFPQQEAARVEVSSPRETEVVADPMLLRQSLLVMLQNALDATEAEDAVRLTIQVNEAGACFEVWNPGHIQLEHPKDKMFEPFFTTKAQNLGVGLPMARRIAEAHSGTLQLKRSSASEGTCFVLDVPLLDP